MGTGGWKTPWPPRFGGGAHESVENAYQSLRSNIGDALSDEEDSATDAETQAAARLLSRADSRLACFVEQSDPRALSTMLPRWEKILGIQPSRNDSDADRRARVSSRLLTTYTASSDGIDAIAKAAFYPWTARAKYIDADDALMLWPGNGNNSSWFSTIAHIIVEYLMPAWASRDAADKRAAMCVKALDEFAPAWTTFDTSETQTVGDNALSMGFYLDQPNIDVAVFWDGPAPTPAAAPTVAITSPLGSSTWDVDTDGDTLTVSGTCTDSTSVLVEINSGSGYVAFGTDASVSGDVFSVAASVASHVADPVLLRATATGPGGSTVSSVISITIEDTGVVAPTCAITVPSDSFTDTEGETMTVSGTCTDSTSVEVFMNVDGAGYVSIGEDTTVSGDAFSIDYVLDSGDVGSVVLRATATGAGGTANSATVSGTIEAAAAAPTVSITSPAGSSTHIKETALTITVQGNCTDSTSVELFASVDGGAYASWGTDATVSGGTWEVVRTIQAGDIGAVNLRATATGAGGSTNSAVVAITVRNWVPSDWGADRLVWYDASDVTLSGSNVTAWADQVASNDATEGTSTYQGTATTDAGLNGEDVVTIASDNYDVSGASMSSGPWSVLVVANSSDESSIQRWFDTQTGRRFIAHTNNTGGTEAASFYESAYVLFNDNTAINGAGTRIYAFDNTTATLYDHTGSLDTAVSGGDKAIGGTSRIFSAYNTKTAGMILNAKVAEIGILKRHATTSDVNLWAGYVLRRYGIGA